MKRITVVIPARFGSKRLPGKPLLEIHGKPMIYWVARRVARSTVDNYLVATDDHRIMDACRRYKIPCELTSADCINGTERVAEVSTKIDSDYFINVQGDEPLIDVGAINAMCTHLQKKKPEGFIQGMSYLDEESAGDESIVKMAVSVRSRVFYLSRKAIPSSASQDKKSFYRCIGLYGYSAHFCRLFSDKRPLNLEIAEQIEQLRCIEYGLPISAILVADNGISVDTVCDLEKVRKLAPSRLLEYLD